MNNITFTGRLVEDAKAISYTRTSDNSQQQFVKIVVIENVVRRGQGEPKQDNDTLMYPCSMVANKGTMALKKGQKIVISGQLTPNVYTNSKGDKVYGYEVRVNQWEYASDSKPAQAQTAAVPGVAQTAPAPAPTAAAPDSAAIMAALSKVQGGQINPEALASMLAANTAAAPVAPAPAPTAAPAAPVVPEFAAMAGMSFDAMPFN